MADLRSLIKVPVETSIDSGHCPYGEARRNGQHGDLHNAENMKCGPAERHAEPVSKQDWQQLVREALENALLHRQETLDPVIVQQLQAELCQTLSFIIDQHRSGQPTDAPAAVKAKEPKIREDSVETLHGECESAPFQWKQEGKAEGSQQRQLALTIMAQSSIQKEHTPRQTTPSSSPRAFLLDFPETGGAKAPFSTEVRSLKGRRRPAGTEFSPSPRKSPDGSEGRGGVRRTRGTLLHGNGGSRSPLSPRRAKSAEDTFASGWNEHIPGGMVGSSADIVLTRTRKLGNLPET